MFSKFGNFFVEPDENNSKNSKKNYDVKSNLGFVPQKYYFDLAKCIHISLDINNQNKKEILKQFLKFLALPWPSGDYDPISIFSSFVFGGKFRDKEFLTSPIVTRFLINKEERKLILKLDFPQPEAILFAINDVQNELMQIKFPLGNTSGITSLKLSCIEDEIEISIVRFDFEDKPMIISEVNRKCDLDLESFYIDQTIYIGDIKNDGFVTKYDNGITTQSSLVD
jgi:hypothetical protein